MIHFLSLQSYRYDSPLLAQLSYRSNLIATDQNFINQPFGCRSTKNHSFPPNIIIQSPDQNILKQRVNKSIMDQSVHRSILNQAPDRSNINHPFNQSIMNLFSPERRKQQVDNEVNFVQYSKACSEIIFFKGGGGVSAPLGANKPPENQILNQLPLNMPMPIPKRGFKC